jgi:AAA domain-containing protein
VNRQGPGPITRATPGNNSEQRPSSEHFRDSEVEKQSEAEKISKAIKASVCSGSKLLEVELPERAKVIDEWFREADYGLIFGHRGLGKSWIGLGLAVGPFQSNVGWPVLYVDGEMVLSVIRERIVALHGSCPENLHVLSHELLFHQEQATLNLARVEHQEAILNQCLENGIRVLILDNLSCLMSGIKENEADSWETVKLWFLRLRRHRIAVVLVHHSGRSGKDLRGTSKREDDAFWIMRLEEPANEKGGVRGARFVSRFTKNRNSPADPLSFDWTIEPEVDGTVKIKTVETSSDDVIVQWVRDGLTTASEIATEMGVTKGTVSKRAARLIESGRLEKNGRGYKLGTLESTW